MDARHLLAEVNVSRMRGDLHSSRMSGFVHALGPVYGEADRAPGFVWRLESPDQPVVTAPGDPRLTVTVSVWESYDALHAYVYRSGHGPVMRRRIQWFRPVQRPATALWWVREGAMPTLDEALSRLALLRREGPGPRVFTLRNQFTPDGQRVARRRRPGI